MLELNDKVEYIHKEYERLHGVVNAYSQSSFDDFKLLAVLGLVFAWDPMMKWINGQSTSSDPKMLFLGFVVTLVLSAIIAVRDLLKQSLMIFNHLQIKACEKQLREMLGDEGGRVFRGTENWKNWYRSTHARVALTFYGLYSSSIIFFSAAVLYWRTGWEYALLYLLLAFLTSAFPVFAFGSLYQQFAKAQCQDASCESSTGCVSE